MGDLRRLCGLAGLTVFFLIWRPTCTDAVRVPSPPVCPLESLKDSIFASRSDVCYISRDLFSHTVGVIEAMQAAEVVIREIAIEPLVNDFCKKQYLYLQCLPLFNPIFWNVAGDEVALQKALHMVHKNENDYASVLFYSAWCPFSGTFRPKLSILSSIFPSIPHFAIEESSVRPSILSKYGVYGFPTLILLNSTMRVRYQGSRSMDSLITFYGEVTGLKTSSADPVYLEKIGCSGYDEKHNTYQETCPFPWAKSPENLLQQETYLALATFFVIMRLLYYTFPTLRRYGELAWRRYIINADFSSLWERSVVHINRLLQLFKSLNEPCKKSNLQEGAKNAKAWASKSLATVSFGDASSSHNAQ